MDIADRSEGDAPTHVFLINPASGKGRLSRKRAVVDRIAAGLDARIVVSTSEADAARIAAEAMRAGMIVVGCGGDGIQNVIAQQAVETGGVMAVLPLGRGNDFAASLGIRSAEDTAAALRAGRVHQARYVEVSLGGATRIALTCVGVGLLSEASFRAARLPFLRGRALYACAALISILRHECCDYRLSLDGRPQRQRLTILLGAASEYTGGGIPIAPRAGDVPGKLNLLYATCLGRAEAFGLLIRALSGDHLGRRGVENGYVELCEVAAEGAGKLASLVYGDGEELGRLPARFRIGARPLRVLVPDSGGPQR